MAIHLVMLEMLDFCYGEMKYQMKYRGTSFIFLRHYRRSVDYFFRNAQFNSKIIE